MINKNNILYIFEYNTLLENIVYQKDEAVKEKLLEKLYSIDYFVISNGYYLTKIKVWLNLFNNGILPNKIFNCSYDDKNNKKFLKCLKTIKNKHKQIKNFLYVDDNENNRNYSLKEMSTCNFVGFKRLIQIN